MLNAVAKLRFEKPERLLILLLRLGMGWVMLYAGMSKIIDTSWSFAPQLLKSNYLQHVIAWLTLPDNIVWVDFFVRWGMVLIGLGLIIGLAVRYASWFGIFLTMCFYILALDVPEVTGSVFRSFLIDEHIIYVLVFLLLIGTRAGEVWGVDRFLKNHNIFARKVKEPKGGRVS